MSESSSTLGYFGSSYSIENVWGLIVREVCDNNKQYVTFPELRETINSARDIVSWKIRFQNELNLLPKTMITQLTCNAFRWSCLACSLTNRIFVDYRTAFLVFQKSLTSFLPILSWFWGILLHCAILQMGIWGWERERTARKKKSFFFNLFLFSCRIKK